MKAALSFGKAFVDNIRDIKREERAHAMWADVASTINEVSNIVLRLCNEIVKQKENSDKYLLKSKESSYSVCNTEGVRFTYSWTVKESNYKLIVNDGRRIFRMDENAAIWFDVPNLVTVEEVHSTLERLLSRPDELRQSIGQSLFTFLKIPRIVQVLESTVPRLTKRKTTTGLPANTTVPQRTVPGQAYPPLTSNPVPIPVSDQFTHTGPARLSSGKFSWGSTPTENDVQHMINNDFQAIDGPPLPAPPPSYHTPLSTTSLHPYSGSYPPSFGQAPNFGAAYNRNTVLSSTPGGLGNTGLYYGGQPPMYYPYYQGNQGLTQASQQQTYHGVQPTFSQGFASKTGNTGSNYQDLFTTEYNGAPSHFK